MKKGTYVGDAELEKNLKGIKANVVEQTGRRPDAGLVLILITVGPGIDGRKCAGNPTNPARIVDTGTYHNATPVCC